MDLLNYPSEIDPAGVRLSILERQSLLIRESDKAPYYHWLGFLHEAFATVNRGYVSRSLNPPTILEPKKGRRWSWDPLPGAGTDRVHYLRRYAAPDSIIAEPEDPVEVAAVRAYAEKYGLRIDEPPNPYASFRNPGVARFMVMTGPRFWTPPIQWVEVQLEFGAPRVPASQLLCEAVPDGTPGGLDYDGY